MNTEIPKVKKSPTGYQISCDTDRWEPVLVDKAPQTMTLNPDCSVKIPKTPKKEWVISKEFHFSASHVLEGLEDGHPCGRTHGHNYIVRLFLKGVPNTNGFVVDYRKLGFAKEYIDTYLDHRHLNDVFSFQTSVENMSAYLYQRFKSNLPELFAIEMSETPKTTCRYEPEN